MNGPDGSEQRKSLEKFREKFARLYPGYLLDKYQHVVAGPNTNVINLRQLTDLLKSSDEQLW